MELIQCKRGEIYYADLGHTGGSEQGGIRPVIVIQNNIGNKFSPTVIVTAVTAKTKSKLPVHVNIDNTYLEHDSTILLEQIRTIDKTKLIEKLGVLNNFELGALNRALQVSIGLS